MWNFHRERNEVCYALGLSHILETGIVCEHKALLDALRWGWVWWDRERIKKGSSSLIPSSSRGKGWSAKLEGGPSTVHMRWVIPVQLTGVVLAASDKCGLGWLPGVCRQPGCPWARLSLSSNHVCAWVVSASTTVSLPSVPSACLQLYFLGHQENEFLCHWVAISEAFESHLMFARLQGSPRRSCVMSHVMSEQRWRRQEEGGW